ncbi:hypothetical protein GcC1_121002 [Golovinomyces cichoracearum]|uniref:Chromo domain-containing protein n=1 Tax=Golovinomyces cichoracearum TaxID=62708 RepID=A0A420I6T5_9PEZI|nr:hypothetical protein GcC1_121002 [Golovinomyces cichoracearum]
MVIKSSTQKEPGSDNDSISLTSTILSAHSENELFEVKKILAENPESNTATFLIQWEGYPVSRATWEPRRQIRHLRPIIKEWRHRQKLEQSGILESFDTKAWATARDESEDERKSRKIRRAIKRKRLQRAANPESDWDVQLYHRGKKSQDLNDEDGLEGTPKNITKEELGVKYKHKSRKSTIPKTTRNRRKVISDDEATDLSAQETVTSNLRRSESPFVSFFQAQPKNPASPMFEKHISSQLPPMSPQKRPSTQSQHRSTSLSNSTSSDESLAQILRRSRAQQSSSTHTKNSSTHPEDEPQTTMSRLHSESSSSEDIPLVKQSQRRCRRRKIQAFNDVPDLSASTADMTSTNKSFLPSLDGENANNTDESIFLPDNTSGQGKNPQNKLTQKTNSDPISKIKTEDQIHPNLIDSKTNEREPNRTENSLTSVIGTKSIPGNPDNSNPRYVDHLNRDAVSREASSIISTEKEKFPPREASEANPRTESRLGHNYKQLRLLNEVESTESREPHLLLDREKKTSSPRIPIRTQIDVGSSGYSFNPGKSSSDEPREKQPKFQSLTPNQHDNVDKTFYHGSNSQRIQTSTTPSQARESAKFLENDQFTVTGLQTEPEIFPKNHLSLSLAISSNNQRANQSSEKKKIHSRNSVQPSNLDLNPSSNLLKSISTDNQSIANLPPVSNDRSDTLSEILTPIISPLHKKSGTLNRDGGGNLGHPSKALSHSLDKNCRNISRRSLYSSGDENLEEHGDTRNNVEILMSSFQTNEYNLKDPKICKPGEQSSRDSATPKQVFEKSLGKDFDKKNPLASKIQPESPTLTPSISSDVQKKADLLFKSAETISTQIPSDTQKICPKDHQKMNHSSTLPCGLNETSQLRLNDNLKSKLIQATTHIDEVSSTHSRDKSVNLRIGISKQRSTNSMNSIVKEVVLGNENQNSAFLNFGKLKLSTEITLKSTIIAVDKIHFNQLCIAQDFQTQDRLKEFPVLWQENISVVNPNDKNAMKIIEMIFNQLVLRSAGLAATVSEYTILLFPVKREEWRYIDQSPEVSPEFRLRYAIFSNRVSDKQKFMPRADNMLKNQSLLLFYESKKALTMELLHDFIPKRKNCSRLCRYYLLFPPAVSRMADFVKFCLNFCNIDFKVYGSMTEGSWDHFSQDNESVKEGFFRVVLIHELAITEIFRIPNLAPILNNTDTVFWQFSDGSLRRPLYPSNYLNLRSKFGDITATELFPHGYAVLLTPSFLVAEPKAAFELIRWFIVERIQKQVPPCRFVGAHNLTSFVLDVAKSKASEAASYEKRHAKDPRKSHVLRERLLDYATCNIRWCLYSELSKLNEYHLTDVGFEENSESCLIQAPSIINADNEHELIRWFAAWSVMKSDIFRKFIVIGTGSSNAPQAKYLKEFPRKDRDYKQNFRTTPQSSTTTLAGTKVLQKQVDDDRLSMFRRAQTLNTVVTEISSVRKIAPTCNSPTTTVNNARRDLSGPVNSSLYHLSNRDKGHGQLPSDQVDMSSRIPLSGKNQIFLSEDVNRDEKSHTRETKTHSELEFENKPTQPARIEYDCKDIRQSVTELKELKFEATTEWYHRLKARGSGWEHITITEYPNIWQLLDFKKP